MGNLLKEQRDYLSAADVPLSTVTNALRVIDYQLHYRVPAITTMTGFETIKPCARTTSAQLIEKMQVMSEYFSISNDARSKVFIGEAFNGQQKAFVLQGLDAILGDVRALQLCTQS